MSTIVQTSTTVSKCRICGGARLEKYLDLGAQPPSNSFIHQDEVKFERKFPLEVYLCVDCGLSQLGCVVSSSGIFSNYVYRSSSSAALRDHYATMVTAIVDLYRPPRNSLIVDIGCNDGITLLAYPKDQFRLLGVEPSSASRYAEQAGITVVKAFFDEYCSQRVVDAHGHAHVVTATNVYAHVPDIRSFTVGIRALLHRDGVCVYEFPYLIDTIEGCYYDTVYHEHLSYLSLTPLVEMFQELGLKAIAVDRQQIGASGPAIRLVICRDDSTRMPDRSIQDMLTDEARWGIKKFDAYRNFQGRIARARDDLLGILDELSGRGEKVGGFAAPAKGNTLLNYSEIDNSRIGVIADRTPEKLGLLTPGTHIPIVSEESFRSMSFKYALLLAWNYADYFCSSSWFVREGGAFIVPLPRPVIRP